MVNSNHGCIAYRLRDINAYIYIYIYRLKIAIFCQLYFDCRPPSGGMPNNTSIIYTSLKKYTCGLQ